MAGRSGRLGIRVSVVILSLLSPALVGPRGFAGDQGGEIGLQLGALAPDHDLSGEPMQLDNVKPFFGIRGDYLFSPHWGFLVDAGMSMFGTESTAFKVVRSINYQKRRSQAAQWISDALYGTFT